MKPSLFGIVQSNRDFSIKETWGKNQFNSSFPTALACYLHSKGLQAVYLELNEKSQVDCKKINIMDVYGLDPLGKDTFYAFESVYTPYETLVIDGLPRIDLVTAQIVEGLTKQIRGLEIKLTALPDNQTAQCPENQYGSEMVVRPDTIVYLALSIASCYLAEKTELQSILKSLKSKVNNWEIVTNVRPHLKEMVDTLDQVLISKISRQTPFLMQPIWKTEAKTLILHENSLDVFVWSDFALTRLFVDVCRSTLRRENMTRHSRTVVWLLKMLLDFSSDGRMNPRRVIDRCTYATKNDKAFAVGGRVTRKYMKTSELLNPRVKKREIKNIILGGGEKLLSPERRFDAAIMSTKEIFE